MISLLPLSTNSLPSSFSVPSLFSLPYIFLQTFLFFLFFLHSIFVHTFPISPTFLISNAFHIFSTFPISHIFLITSMIRGYAKNKFVTQGRFNKMKVKKKQKVTPVPLRNVKKATIDHLTPKFSTIR